MVGRGWTLSGVVGRWPDTVRGGRSLSGRCPEPRKWPDGVGKRYFVLKTPYATAILRCSWRAAPRAEGRRAAFLFGCSLSLSRAGVVTRQCRLSASVFFRFFYFSIFEVGPIVLFGGDTNLLLYPIPCRRAAGFFFLASAGEMPVPCSAPRLGWRNA